MYRFLLVDDEPDVLAYFQRLLEDSLGTTMDIDILTATDARSAYQKIVANKIDILLLDIQMPEISGIDLYHKLRIDYPTIQVLFLTGHATFDYAYASAQDSSARYITKLEPKEKIIAVVEDMLDQVMASYREKELWEQLQEQTFQMLPLLGQRVLAQYLTGRYALIDDLLSEATEAKLPLDLEKKVFLVGAVLDDDSLGFSQSLQHLELLDALMKKHFAKEQVALYQGESHRGLVFWVAQGEELLSRYDAVIDRVQTSFLQTSGTTVTFAHSVDWLTPREVQKIFPIMRSHLLYQWEGASQRILKCLLPAPQEVFSPQENQLQSNRTQELSAYLELGRKQEYFALFDQLTQAISHTESLHHPHRMELYFSMVTYILYYINLWQLNEKIVFTTGLYQLFRIDLYENWGEAVAFLRGISETLFELRDLQEKEQHNHYIHRVLLYIEQNLDKDLSLNALAEYAHLNSSYLSRLFKEEQGENLYDFILQKRMEHACNALISTNKKVQDIAIGVGYPSVPSFHRAFKRVTGKTPTEYRSHGALSEKDTE